MPKIAIIGAGAAGIYSAIEFKKLGLDFVILEKGQQAGNSWRNMPDKLKLISPIKSNVVDKVSLKKYFSKYRMPALEFADYLSSLIEKHQLPIMYGIDVKSVERDGDKFVLDLGDEKNIVCDSLVNATGYFSNPFTPDFEGAKDSKIKQMHFSEYKSPEKLMDDPKKVLVVGKRLSAGQLISELCEHGIETSLSTRGEVKYTSGPFIFNLFLRVLPEIEKIMLRVSNPSSPDVPMEAKDGRHLLKSGKVKVFPNIQRINGSSVTFDGGEEQEFDLIIYATGFRPAVKHLSNLGNECEAEISFKNGFESNFAKNMFYIGVDGQKNFRSRFIRGIKEDVKELAAFLNKRFKDESSL